MHKKSSKTLKLDAVRLDKWLWAARFFKTRQLAIAALKIGKIRLNKQRSKPASKVKLGDQLTIKRGVYEQIVDVMALSETRGSATVAQQLYRETQESTNKQLAIKHQLSSQPKFAPSEHKPNKRDVRLSRAVKRGEE